MEVVSRKEGANRSGMEVGFREEGTNRSGMAVVPRGGSLE